MDKYFASNYSGPAFELFGAAHLIALTCIAALTLLLSLYRNQNDQRKRRVRIMLALLLWANEVAWHYWNYISGTWTLETMLPLQTCSLAVWFAGWMLLFKSQHIYEFVYLLGIGGAIQALATPGLGIYGFPHFVFFLYFLSHGLIIVSAIYMTVVERFRLEAYSGEYNLQLRYDLRHSGVTVYDLTFPSPVKSAIDENNTVYAEYFVPKTLAKVPAVIVLDIMQCNQLIARGEAMWLAQNGVAAMVVVLPHYNQRRAPNSKIKLVSPDIVRTFDGIRQGVLDCRCACAWLAGRPEVDADNLGKAAQQATDEFIKSLTQGNANIKPRGGYTPMNNINGHNWQLITFDNVNEATGRPELVNIATTPLKNGDLIYMIAVCPTADYPKYQGVFLTIMRSIQLTD